MGRPGSPRTLPSVTSKLTWLIVLCVAALAACTAQAPRTPARTQATAAVPASSTASLLLSPTPLSNPTSVPPVPPVRTRPPTGLPEVDAAIAAVEEGSVERLMAALRYALRPCSTVSSGYDDLGCPPGLGEGDLVQTFNLGRCDAGFVTRHASRTWVEGWLDARPHLVGVYRWTPGAGRWPSGGVMVVFASSFEGREIASSALYFPDAPTTESVLRTGGCVAVPPEEFLIQQAEWGTMEPLGTIVP